MEAEVMGVCVLTEILDLVFNKSLSVQNIIQCIDTLLKKSVMWYFLRIVCSRMKR